MSDQRDNDGRTGDMIVPPNQYAYISDKTKGQISVLVGPFKQSLASTDAPVLYNPASRQYEEVGVSNAKQLWPHAKEGQYIVLSNPVIQGGSIELHPLTGTSSPSVKLAEGREIIVPGPATFPLYPGQSAKMLDGHKLRSNQYLIIEVYNDQEAKENWASSVMKPQTGEEDDPSKLDLVPDLVLGQRLIIPGTKVSFYIPPTGIRVVSKEDQQGDTHYVRDAVTLERLEYCILLNENGNKRYVIGPKVVFPEPTETFLINPSSHASEDRDRRKFRAITLNTNSGLYIQVIADYEDGDGEDSTKVLHKVGEELFITGREQAIYYPRPEHALITYDGKEIHYAIAIPKGEGRYVLNRDSGEVSLVTGPRMFLPDPRKEVVVKRILDAKMCNLIYPGNKEALAYNSVLTDKFEAQELGAGGDAMMLSEASAKGGSRRAFEASDTIQRSTNYTPPRSITLNTKYDGAVTINVWNGYAVMVVDKTGARRVVEGPATILLQYDETLEVMSLSTGKPKTTDIMYDTVYLRVRHNKVSDIINVRTEDLCEVEVKLSYRVDFEGDNPEKWFEVENYVKFLCDHVRSKLKSIARQHDIEDLYANATQIIRDSVLGIAEEGKKRTGLLFEENNMRIYDVEVLSVDIRDREISNLLQGAQYDAFKETLNVAHRERELSNQRRLLQVDRDLAQETSETSAAKMALQQNLEKLKIANEEELLTLRTSQKLNDAAAQQKAYEAKLLVEQAVQEIEELTFAQKLDRERRAEELAAAQKKQQIEDQVAIIRAEVAAVVDKAGAITPDMVSALQAFSDKELVAKVSESMAPLAILGGGSVVDVVSKMFAGTGLEGVLEEVKGRMSHAPKS